jgi:hypothetical protein
LWLPPLTAMLLMLLGGYLMRAAVTVAPLQVLRDLD